MVSVGDWYPQGVLEPNSKDAQVLYKKWSSSVSVESVDSGGLLCALMGNTWEIKDYKKKFKKR